MPLRPECSILMHPDIIICCDSRQLAAVMLVMKSRGTGEVCVLLVVSCVGYPIV